jgi:hypothetical protein
VRELAEPLEVSARPRSALGQVQALLTFIRVTVATDDAINLNKLISIDVSSKETEIKQCHMMKNRQEELGR